VGAGREKKKEIESEEEGGERRTREGGRERG